VTAERAVRISEIFGPTVQGEGRYLGRPTVFVRTGGCDDRCAWCDTPHAVLPEHRHRWQAWAPEAVLTEVERLTVGAPILVSLSGGNPALQPLGPLLAAGRARGHRFVLETQGTQAPAWLAELDGLTLSPKGPSSGCETDPERVAACLAAAGSGPDTVLKVVVMDDTDYDYARAVAERFDHLPVYLQVGNAEPEGDPGPEALLAGYRRLAARVLADRWHDVTVLPQMHILAWGNRPGV
jgi:7-carboxy-7-deazaguanine synthase